VTKQGTVVEYHREYCTVRLEPDGFELLAKPRGQLEFVARREQKDWRKEGRLVFEHSVAVGDSVELEEAADGNAVITAVQPRETWLFRNAYKRDKPLCLVANADQLAVVIAPNPWVKLAVVDRLFLAAIQGGLKPILIVNKLDLNPALQDSVDFKAYVQLGYPVLFTSALSGAGLDELPPLLAGRLTAFCGHSGVGKSSLLSRLTGLSLKTGEVDPDSHKGHYTTETSRIYGLADGAQVVDTPGVRTFGLSRLSWLDVNEYFEDIAALTLECGYRDCKHTAEPDCAVRRAVADGRLSAQRMESFIKLREECESWKHWT
jgi:ribosome biogenesis GTPase / thiamine phosphate phosphatase